MPDQDKSPGRYSPPSDAEIDEAQQNLEATLTAYDNEGEAGLQREMERIHPLKRKVRIPCPNFPGSSLTLDYDHPIDWSNEASSAPKLPGR